MRHIVYGISRLTCFKPSLLLSTLSNSALAVHTTYPGGDWPKQILHVQVKKKLPTRQLQRGSPACVQATPCLSASRLQVTSHTGLLETREREQHDHTLSSLCHEEFGLHSKP